MSVTLSGSLFIFVFMYHFMFIFHVHVHVLTAWTKSMDMQHGHEAWPWAQACSMGIALVHNYAKVRYYVYIDIVLQFNRITWTPKCTIFAAVIVAGHRYLR